MHIPDGYLSPSTCVTMYALASAGWYSAIKRTKRLLATRTIPLIAMFAAFSFVVMMFNLPLPGGTTGHAVGVTIAAIVLGPAGAIVSISIALFLQALFFGDGGITTFGANCVNMAIVGSLVAFAAYRLIARSSSSPSRRVFAAGVAGYFAINVSALLTAFEFGIQPLLFHDAHGTPLYAPYGLQIAIPAMMVGHLTVAGFAEAFLSAGMLSFFQRTERALLDKGPISAASTVVSPDINRLWLALGLLTLLTPLGVLATGTAWGEWRPSELAARMDAGSSHASIPSGIAKLSGIWTAPFPAYAPPFVRSPVFGYLLSASFVVGILLLSSLLIKSVAGRRDSRDLVS
ncbi:MAG TPA: cobalt transporter CbiM [Terriglobales bacterium]|jgi:cobalt/nickel transport system permease protein